MRYFATPERNYTTILTLLYSFKLSLLPFYVVSILFVGRHLPEMLRKNAIGVKQTVQHFKPMSSTKTAKK